MSKVRHTGVDRKGVEPIDLAAVVSAQSAAYLVIDQGTGSLEFCDAKAEALLGIEFWTGSILIVLITGIYTALGGLRAVVFTDMVQMFILVGGGVAVTIFGLSEIGGWDELVARSKPNDLSLWRSVC